MDGRGVTLNAEITGEHGEAGVGLAAAKADGIGREAIRKHCLRMKFSILGADCVQTFQIAIRHGHHARADAASPPMAVGAIRTNSRVLESFLRGRESEAMGA